MAQKLGDLGRYFSPGLTLTVLGREYTLPLPSAELGLWCRLVAQVAGDVTAASTDEQMQAAVDRIEALPELPGGRDVTLPQRVLGDVYEQLVADKVPDPYLQFCGQTAYVWILAGEDKAAEYWTSGGRPEAQRPANRETRRAQRGQTSTAAAAATRSAASGSGTRSRKTSSASTPPAKAAASRGRKSSSTG